MSHLNYCECCQEGTLQIVLSINLFALIRSGLIRELGHKRLDTTPYNYKNKLDG